MDILVVTLIVLIVIFVLVRAFWLWYWKINEGISLLKAIRDELQALNHGLVKPEPAVPPAAPVPPAAGTRIRLFRTVQLRVEPREDAPATATIYGGATVTVLKTDGAWAWIQADDDKEGWVPLPLDR